MRDRRGAAATLNQLGQLALNEQEYSRAATLLKQGLAIHRELGDKRGIAAALKNLAAVARAQADHEQERTYLIESLALFEKLGDRRNVTECHARLRDTDTALDAEPRVNYARAESAATGTQITEGGSGVIT
jgi:tetratricopeptide (TPR) repeat protein